MNSQTRGKTMNLPRFRPPSRCNTLHPSLCVWMSVLKITMRDRFYQPLGYMIWRIYLCDGEGERLKAGCLWRLYEANLRLDFSFLLECTHGPKLFRKSHPSSSNLSRYRSLMYLSGSQLTCHIFLFEEAKWKVMDPT